jgi:large subunit ribosomal protein L23
MKNEVIKGVYLTEKAAINREMNQTYVFEVDQRANKKLVKEAVERIFQVKSKKVNILNAKPKQKRVGRYTGNTKSKKKAYVILEDGHSIESIN